MDSAPIDWSWFFSSVAQSAAAMVGIIGGFVIGKILAIQQQHAELAREVQHIVDRGREVAESFAGMRHDAIDDWYSMKADFEARKTLGPDSNLDPTSLVASMREKIVFPPWVKDADILKIIASRVAAVRDFLEIAERRAEANLAPEEFKPEYGVCRNISTNFRQELESMCSLRQQAEEHIQRIGFFMKNRSSASPRWLIPITLAVVAFLFFAGVIYPLSFLPIKPGSVPELEYTVSAFMEILCSLRGVVLTLISAAVMALLVLFGWLYSVSTKHPPLWRKMVELLDLKAYSPYFSSWEFVDWLEGRESVVPPIETGST